MKSSIPNPDTAPLSQTPIKTQDLAISVPELRTSGLGLQALPEPGLISPSLAWPMLTHPVMRWLRRADPVLA